MESRYCDRCGNARTCVTCVPGQITNAAEAALVNGPLYGYRHGSHEIADAIRFGARAICCEIAALREVLRMRNGDPYRG